jgi:hypothetical protein
MIAEGVPLTIRAHLRQLGLPSNLSDVMKLTQQARSRLPFEIAPPLRDRASPSPPAHLPSCPWHRSCTT